MGRTVREMTRKVDEAIMEVNSILDAGWTKEQLRKGKHIPCAPEWVPVAGTLLNQYRSAGWEVKINVEITNFGREFAFKFLYPEKEGVI